jgi:photosystem II stability/assembly factor-like uncharacterized protein
MKRKILILLYPFLMIILFSCRKSNSVAQSNPPGKPDSLLNWKETGIIPGIFLNDIWFISPSRGYVIGDSDIYQSVDSGLTWSIVPNSTSNTNGNILYNLFFVNAQYGFVQGSPGLL